ncbi:uncharacterized protein TRIADDRAFT_62413 [Trichoplax adhaerens]|uniref:FZ domain-containing protein n=1 Tax=Trichoplax adhaerens TaxID=10228 RepID=B3SDQ6_TRIAD|nr:predicted protein [Trichoplax adhaerens]EDV19138.1 predicted protein [Trichoplax adhaerens]|eukprot:XP_002118371.1 predicted protein [Trichoplax adhaerens]
MSENWQVLFLCILLCFGTGARTQENTTVLYAMERSRCVEFELRHSTLNLGSKSISLYAASQSQLLFDEIVGLAVDAITLNETSSCGNDIRKLIVDLLYPTCSSKPAQLKYQPSQCLANNPKCRQVIQQSNFAFLLEICHNKQNTTVYQNSTTCNIQLTTLCKPLYQQNMRMPTYMAELALLGLRIYQRGLQKFNSLTNEQPQAKDYQFYCLHLPLCNLNNNSDNLWFQRYSILPNQQDRIVNMLQPIAVPSNTVFTRQDSIKIYNIPVRGVQILNTEFQF